MLGQVSDYAAANSFMDAFVNYRTKADYPGKSIYLHKLDALVERWDGN